MKIKKGADCVAWRSCPNVFFRNHNRRIHVQGEGKILLIVWHGVFKKAVSEKPFTEGAQEAKRTSIVAGLQPLSV